MDSLRVLGLFLRLYAVALVVAAAAIVLVVFPKVVPDVSSPVFASMWYLVVGVGLTVLFLAFLTVYNRRGDW